MTWALNNNLFYWKLNRQHRYTNRLNSVERIEYVYAHTLYEWHELQHNVNEKHSEGEREAFWIDRDSEPKPIHIKTRLKGKENALIHIANRSKKFIRKNRFHVCRCRTFSIPPQSHLVKKKSVLPFMIYVWLGWLSIFPLWALLFTAYCWFYSFFMLSLSPFLSFDSFSLLSRMR